MRQAATCIRALVAERDGAVEKADLYLEQMDLKDSAYDLLLKKSLAAIDEGHAAAAEALAERGAALAVLRDLVENDELRWSDVTDLRARAVALLGVKS
jgi:hypothetical protein